MANNPPNGQTVADLCSGAFKIILLFLVFYLPYFFTENRKNILKEEMVIGILWQACRAMLIYWPWLVRIPQLALLFAGYFSVLSTAFFLLRLHCSAGCTAILSPAYGSLFGGLSALPGLNLHVLFHLENVCAQRRMSAAQWNLFSNT